MSATLTSIIDRDITIGSYKAKAVPTGIFGLDGGAMFGTVPKVLWEKSNPPDEQNRIRMEARALLLIDTNSPKRILIDCGIGGDFIAKYGEKLGGKFKEMYAVGSSNVESALKMHGVALSEITDVILTHLHFDHCGGATTERDGKLVPTFPNATYYVQKANLETARNPNMRERASYYGANFEPLIEAGVLKILDGPVQELLPGVSVSITNGHTQGQQVVKISDGATSLLYCADLIPTSSHVRLPWVMGYDLQPVVLIEEKRELLTPAAKEKWFLFFEHDPDVDCATVVENRGDFNVLERFTIATV